MQPAISALLELGPFPSSETATAVKIQAFEEHLSKIQPPVTDQEACLLLKLFGPDDCFGLSWTLLHLIETAPGWPIKSVLNELEGEWIDRLRERMTIKTSIIVAMAENRCIGLDNKMPWHIGEDLKRFKSLTMGHPVIMGRKTYESILGYLGKPLPGRTNIIISRNGFENLHEVPVFEKLEKAISYGQKLAKSEVFIIGGAQVYLQALPLADIIHLTQVHKSVEGDAFFPEIDQNNWTEITCEDHLTNDPPYSFITLKKRG